MLRAQANPGESGRGVFSAEDFVTDEVTGINCYTFSDRVKTRLQEIGVGDQSERPRLADDHKGVFHGLKPGDYFNGRLPVVIRRLSLDQLSALYSLFSRWYGYLVFQTNLIAAERSEASKQKEFLWSHIRKQYRYKDDGKTKNSDQLMSDLARGDFRFVKANAQYEELNVLYNCMQATLEVTEQDMKVISREVTIIQAKQEHDFTGGGFRGRASRPWSGGGDGETNKTNAGPRSSGPNGKGPGSSGRGRRPIVVTGR